MIRPKPCSSPMTPKDASPPDIMGGTLLYAADLVPRNRR